ncbi:hypothetical protein F5X68DRAFT_23038 [Plectosphaerella plurivora]|uniref:NACHT-NTPase and P-loop NTPases N-terminal domain-containing protein n=1 Tax=Plectosphaerella plurivora TaxID=936078 RepID=A0A9P9A8L3_9PEZI|nr:hypothetical protein F5X68DRAFT_23038 [Plectosphaerella plurivora]
MSGAEALGIASGIITLIEASAKLYRAANDVSGLPAALNDVAARLPLVQCTLVNIHDTLLQDSPAPEDRHALGRALEACRDKASSLEAIFQAVVPGPGASRVERYRKALHAVSRSEKATGLMEGILADLQLLMSTRIFQGRIPGAMEIEGKTPTRVVRQQSFFANTGSGGQYIHEGEGGQNINFGQGPQFHGPITGSLYFTAQP